MIWMPGLAAGEPAARSGSASNAFRYRNQQISCAAEIGGFQDIGTCGVSNDGLEVALAQLRNDIVRVLDNEKRRLLVLFKASATMLPTRPWPTSIV